MDVSIVIPTYNRQKVLGKVLPALGHQTYPAEKYEIIIVDDGSTDDTEAFVKSLDMPCRLAYRRIERRGPAGARNEGIRMAQGDLIIFIDSDLIVTEDFISSHVKAHKTPRDIVHGPVIHTNDLENATSTKMKITDISRAFFATGNVSIRKDQLMAAGLFDEDFREYGWEDLELGIRLARLKMRKVDCPSCVGYHYKSSLSLDHLPALKQKEIERGHTAVLFLKKWPTLEVRYMVLSTPLFYGLDRLLTLGNWPDWPGTMNLLSRLEKSGHRMTMRFLVRIITNHAYFEGMREAFRAGK